ncbi:MAG: ethylbenzene dehydrogenase-related protein [Pseudomonadota bacterium]|nr:ethylbenzene dehydrogenase-related protein [Pseudomonadota bacterium]
MLALLSPAWAAPTLERVLPVGLVEAPPSLDPLDAAWSGAPVASVSLYPQATAPGGPGGATRTLEARVLRGGGKLALRLAWPDATADLADAKATDRFADAAAVQFAPAAGTLPYVGMGEPGHPVRVWFWRAGQPAQGLTAQGFGSLSRQPGEAVEAQSRRTATGWAVVLRGAESADRPAAVAFAAWDGAEDGRAGRKRLSAWRALAKPDARLLEEMRTTGDPARGARLYAEHGCAACHRGDSPHARNSGSLPPEGAQSPAWGGPAPGMGAGLGPDLTHAGGIHWPGYLRRAIREPAAFLVPGYAAIMPVLPLRPEETEALVAYLMTLN